MRCLSTKHPRSVLSISNSANIGYDGTSGTDQTHQTIQRFTTVSFQADPMSAAHYCQHHLDSQQSPYILTCDVTVNTGVTLTILPGTIVKFNATSRRLIVNGMLIAQGQQPQKSTSPLSKTIQLAAIATGTGLQPSLRQEIGAPSW